MDRQKKKTKKKPSARKSRATTSKDVTISAGKAERAAAIALRTKSEIEGLNAILQSRDRLKIMAREGNVGDLIDQIRKRKSELRKILLKRNFERPRLWSRRVQKDSRGRGASLEFHRGEFRREIQVDIPSLNVIQQAQSLAVNCPLIEIGVVQASGFREYAWNTPGRDSTRGATAFWPLSQSMSLPNTTFTGDWTGETGANFWGWVDVQGSWWILADYLDSIATAAVLKFRLPPSPCPSLVMWGTWALADAPTPWIVDADQGLLDTDWVIREDPSGGDFPNSLIQSFQFLPDGLHQTANDTNPVKRKWTNLDGSFSVQPNVAPTIYLGCSLYCQAKDGRASTIDIGGTGDHFNFENGVTFIRINGN